MNPKGPPLTQPSWVLSPASQSCLGPFGRLVNSRHLFLVAAELGAYVLAWGLMQLLFWVWAPTSLCPLTVVGTGALTIVGAPASCPDPYPKAPPPSITLGVSRVNSGDLAACTCLPSFLPGA